MLTRAIIVDIDYKENKLKLNIPILDTFKIDIEDAKKEKLNWASIMCVPGIDIDYKVGDVVIVGFEEDNISHPIVLGYLKLSGEQAAPRAYGKFKEVSISECLEAPTNTKIGKTDYSQIFDVVAQIKEK